MSLKAKLIVVGGAVEDTEVTLDLPAVIGRGRSAQITIPHALVSRQHCQIDEADGQLTVRDLGSLNGTYIGNEQITEASLPPGGLLTVGTVTFRAMYESASQTANQLLAGRSEDSTVEGLAAVEDDTTRLDPSEVPPDVLPPVLPPATVKEP